MDKTEWSKMAWTEIREAESRRPVVLLPIGTLETHGPHTFVGLEFHLAEALAREAAARTRALVLPGIPFGYSEMFTAFPGTISIDPETLTGFYHDVVRSVIRSGFEHILLVANHLPNQPMIEHVAARVRNDTGVLIAWVNPQTMAASFLKDAFPDPAAVRGHGAEPGLSLALYLDESAVDTSRAQALPAAREFRGAPVQGLTLTVGGSAIGFPLRLDDVAPVYGGYGNPTQGSRRAGELIFSRLLDYLVGLIEWFQRVDTTVPVRS